MAGERLIKKSFLFHSPLPVSQPPPGVLSPPPSFAWFASLPGTLDSESGVWALFSAFSWVVVWEDALGGGCSNDIGVDDGHYPPHPRFHQHTRCLPLRARQLDGAVPDFRPPLCLPHLGRHDWGRSPRPGGCYNQIRFLSSLHWVVLERRHGRLCRWPTLVWIPRMSYYTQHPTTPPTPPHPHPTHSPPHSCQMKSLLRM